MSTGDRVESKEDFQPLNIDIMGQGIRIEWNDGHNSVYPHRFLRLRCPCAHCVDEWTRAQRLDPETVPQDVKAVDHMTLGNYAVEFLWSDTHYTGIYTYDFLRSVCTCMQCAANKE